ncbi:MAG TPA: FkbM family methyltransferase [Pyrinomonadaceae bacterium]|nr:FkbM family methyltransferase [Pyrinomonadaceae bacterium]
MATPIKNVFYGALDAVTLYRGVPRSIGSERMLFPAKWSRYYESDYEPETFRFFRSNVKPGNVVLDIGAHIGLFSVVTSRLVGETGKVYAFEPTPFTRGVLGEVVKLNGCEHNVEIRPEAVSDKEGTAYFFDTGTEVSNANSLVETGRSKEKIEVPMISVDKFASERGLTVKCLKIDVEGAELDLLKGARKVLTEQRPVARLGLHPEFMAANGHTLEMIWDLIKYYRYRPDYNGSAITKQEFCSQPTLFDVNLFPIQ